MAMWSTEIRSTSLSIPHGANSLIHIFFFTPIDKDELAVMQRRIEVELPAEPRIASTFCYALAFNFYLINSLKLSLSITNPFAL